MGTEWVKSLVHYLDDFLFGGPEDTPVCQMMLDTFSDICEELGVPIASEKSVGPVTSLKFLGLVIDTVEMVVRIPQDKLLKLKSLLEPILFNKKITHKDLESVVGLEVSVWIVGSSLIRNAFVHARSRTGGVNLGLHRIGVKIWWQGYGGMGLKDLESTIKRLMKYEKAPKYLVLHIAGNDFGKTKLGFLRNEIKATLEKVQSYLPNSSIVWSQILPRTNWRHSISQDSMMACRIRINSAIASFVLKNGGHYIKYPDILPNSTFLKEDGVHLTDLGNDIFLNNLQGALEMFICSGSYTYPDTFGTSMYILSNFKTVLATVLSQLHPHFSGG
ncbi:unnamed protein product [Mytilus edulis]|uniref:Reverse transcriptase domain-containing protein n=1 Tax=Mytilus edulis TaxID=6550 RepID=A0A8S3S7J9_MYTED|nr:unnamed protein product [Mytilus edulis]